MLMEFHYQSISVADIGTCFGWADSGFYCRHGR